MRRCGHGLARVSSAGTDRRNGRCAALAERLVQERLVQRRLVGRMALVLLVAGLASSCHAHQTSARTDLPTDFATYRTYAWMRHVDSLARSRDSIGYDDEILEGRIHALLGKELTTRGLRRDAAEPDILLQYHLGSREVERVIAEPRYDYYQDPYEVVNAMRVEHVINGRLLIDVIDRRTKRLVWRGVSIGELPSPSAFDRDLWGDRARVVRHVFEVARREVVRAHPRSAPRRERQKRQVTRSA